MTRLTRRIRDFATRKYEGLYPTRAEAKLVEVLGGTTLTIGRLRRQGRPMVVILSRGRLLRSERFRRAALDGDGFLANDIRWAIAIQGPEYERDVVAAYERDEWLKEQGWYVRWIPQRWLWDHPERVKTAVQQFIGS